MNQSVQILDGFQWTEQGLKIQAMVSGFILDCLITGVEQELAEAIYTQYQFDIEEYLQQALDEVDLDADDSFYCAISDIL